MQFIDPPSHRPLARRCGRRRPAAAPAGARPQPAHAGAMACGARHLARHRAVPASSSPNTTGHRSLAADLPRLALVVLQFPKWVDGRAYTQARLLRARCRLPRRAARHRRRAGRHAAAAGSAPASPAPSCARPEARGAAERALGFFPGHYQGDVTQPKPAFARDLAAESRPLPANGPAPSCHAGAGHLKDHRHARHRPLRPRRRRLSSTAWPPRCSACATPPSRRTRARIVQATSLGAEDMVVTDLIARHQTAHRAWPRWKPARCMPRPWR